ncbi:hypothetical protein BJ912DRAFT_1080031 [Pholiota molesta]|nr:hypothetical protein BJ912DRAFT_1080031 [Pholiota molesta]
MSIHSVKRSHTHLAWDNSIPPVIKIQSGEEVSFSCLDGSNGQITKESTAVALTSLDFSQVDQVMEVLSVEPAEWGWTGLIPGFGLLSDEFPEPALKIWTLDRDAGFTWFDEERGSRFPGRVLDYPPYHTGGNLDTRQLTVGSTLYLPVEVEGALFSIGDGHAAQGDGGTAIETPMDVKVRLTVRKDRPYTKTPHFQTLRPNAATRSTTARQENMINFLEADVAGDLRMHEVVDMPNYVIGIMLPKSLLRGHRS